LSETPESRRVKATPNPWDIGFGVVVLVGALLALFVWFPNDINGGFMQVSAIGRNEPGDAFFPILLALLLAGLGVLQIALPALGRALRTDDENPVIRTENLLFLVKFLGIVVAGLTVMFWLGPLTVAALNTPGLIEGSYRQYTDTAPYKYIGYVVGGFGMTATLIVWTEGRARRIALITVAGVLAASILIFDIALTNVLLPPNGEF